MKILVDENIPFGREAFGRLGEVVTLHGRKIDAAAARDADLLIIRSITRVGRELLEGSRVRFVGTCTIGTDHVDETWLRQRGIAFASAPGCNANSVAEYVAAALLLLAHRGGYRVEGKTLGVVGVGNVGAKVVAKCQALGMRVLQNDPPLARANPGQERFRPLEELVAKADFITLHVPLAAEGPDRTWHLADRALLRAMKPGAALINTSRGAVVDNRAAVECRRNLGAPTLVLDVWEGEPNLDVDLLERVALGTPHIAGYSWDGKVNGTLMVYHAARRCLEMAPDPGMTTLLTALMGASSLLKLNAEGRFDEEVIREAVSRAYDIAADDRRLRAIADLPEGERGAYFDRLRKEYPQRREFHNTTVEAAGGQAALWRKLDGIGFNAI